MRFNLNYYYLLSWIVYFFFLFVFPRLKLTETRQQKNNNTRALETINAYYKIVHSPLIRLFFFFEFHFLFRMNGIPLCLALSRAIVHIYWIELLLAYVCTIWMQCVASDVGSWVKLTRMAMSHPLLVTICSNHEHFWRSPSITHVARSQHSSTGDGGNNHLRSPKNMQVNIEWKKKIKKTNEKLFEINFNATIMVFSLTSCQVFPLYMMYGRKCLFIKNSPWMECLCDVCWMKRKSEWERERA